MLRENGVKIEKGNLLLEVVVNGSACGIICRDRRHDQFCVAFREASLNSDQLRELASKLDELRENKQNGG